MANITIAGLGGLYVKLYTNDDSHAMTGKPSIFDHLGRETTKLPENSMNGYDISLKMNNAAKGIYVVQIRTNKGIAIKKILVQ